MLLVRLVSICRDKLQSHGCQIILKNLGTTGPAMNLTDGTVAWFTAVFWPQIGGLLGFGPLAAYNLNDTSRGNSGLIGLGLKQAQ